MAEWQPIATGDQDNVDDLFLDFSQQAYLLHVDLGFDVPDGIVGAIESAISALGLPVSVRLLDQTTVEIQIGDTGG